MKIIKAVLRPDRVRETPEQFSWVDQALVQHHLIDRCDNRSAALYLFLITVADAQGLSYYGSPTLTARLHLSADELALARQQLIELGLVAYQAPLYQVLAIPGTQMTSARTPSATPPAAALSTRELAATPTRRVNAGPLSLAQLIELERRHARL
jgi:hypothetical protein